MQVSQPLQAILDPDAPFLPDQVTYWTMIVCTVIVALCGVFLSFVYRLIKRRVSKHARLGAVNWRES